VVQPLVDKCVQTSEALRQLHPPPRAVVSRNPPAWIPESELRPAPGDGLASLPTFKNSISALVLTSTRIHILRFSGYAVTERLSILARVCVYCRDSAASSWLTFTPILGT